MTPDEFTKLRFGMIVHYGVYSLLERGEWAINRERIPADEYRALAKKFTAEKFDAGALCDLAVNSGMRYICFTSMHHDGFRLYDTKLSDFSSAKSAAKRDITMEVLQAARQRGLKFSLYHTLNNLIDRPDAVDALEDPAAYQTFIQRTHQRFDEVLRRFTPVDVLWYDGWWPFNAEGWQAEKLNALARSIQPNLLFNGRNGLPGDFSTPEGHLGAPHPWRPWEACMTLNDNWGYHAGDHNWKTPTQVVDMLATVASARGNLLLNVGPRGDGSIPQPTIDVLLAVGQWLKRCGESVYDTDNFTYSLRDRGEHRGDWLHSGPITAKGNNLYFFLRRWTGNRFAFGGLRAKVLRASLLGQERPVVTFTQEPDRVVVSGLPDQPTDPVCPVLKVECDRVPEMYLTGGMRIPKVPHPPYDPCPSELAHG